MSAECDIIANLVNGSRGIEWVVERIRDNVQGVLEPPTKDEFWKQLVLAMLSSQQPSTKGTKADLFGVENVWSTIELRIEGLHLQRVGPPDPSHKELERKGAGVPR